jgi:DNA-binding NarL/FixJ family response regulator
MDHEPGGSTARVFIVEDHQDMREVLQEYIGEAIGLVVCGTAGDAESALESLRDLDLDLVVVDVSLPGMSGIDLVKHLQDRSPDLPCLVLSGHGEPTYVARALGAGARGYVLKGNARELPGAIQDVLAGETYLSRPLRERLARSLGEPPETGAIGSPPATSA